MQGRQIATTGGSYLGTQRAGERAMTRPPALYFRKYDTGRSGAGSVVGCRRAAGVHAPATRVGLGCESGQ